MCRLGLISLTNTSYYNRAYLFHQLMLMQGYGGSSVNSPAQIDGYGITNGDVVVKSSEPYFLSGVDWIQDLKQDGKNTVIMGHLRRATPGTPAKAPHPFTIVLKDGTILQLVHNGVFKGVGGWQQSDTEAAAGLFPDFFLKKDDLSNPGVWTNWLSSFEDGSAYAILVRPLDSDQTFMVKNSLRSLHCMQYGEGLITATDDTVLKAIAEHYIPKHTDGKIWTYSTNILVSIPDNNQELINLGPVEPTLKKKTVVTINPRPGYDYRITQKNNAKTRFKNRKAFVENNVVDKVLVPEDLDWNDLRKRDLVPDLYETMLSLCDLTPGLLALWLAKWNDYTFELDGQRYYDIYNAVITFDQQTFDDFSNHVGDKARSNLVGYRRHNQEPFVGWAIANKLDKFHELVDSFVFWLMKPENTITGQSLSDLIYEFSYILVQIMVKNGYVDQPVIWLPGILTLDELEAVIELIQEEVDSKAFDLSFDTEEKK